ncbi:hypothetical protein OG906_36345 (plasmid) [Streptomyces sp. NBC_01426]|uniref:hypothetical protein n=1 Tax=unclassified Streptomyces TaxID=2593676 RepID=UPI002E2F5CDF|nr:hypothetical protein [Streptomyces sp. NBC_01426]
MSRIVASVLTSVVLLAVAGTTTAATAAAEPAPVRHVTAGDGYGWGTPLDDGGTSLDVTTPANGGGTTRHAG